MRKACLLLSLLLLWPGLSVPCQAGNKALMEKWAAKKQYVRDQILEELRKQGDLPQDGTIHFEARIKTEPDGKVTTFEVDSVEVFERTPAAAQTQKAEAQSASGVAGGAGKIREGTIDFAQTAPGAGVSGRLTGTTHTLRVHGRLTEGVLDIPGTAVIKEDIVLQGGQPAAAQEAPEQAPAPKSADPAEKPGTDAEKSGADKDKSEVGDTKTGKSWWKVW